MSEPHILVVDEETTTSPSPFLEKTLKDFSGQTHYLSSIEQVMALDNLQDFSLILYKNSAEISLEKMDELDSFLFECQPVPVLYLTSSYDPELLLELMIRGIFAYLDLSRQQHEVMNFLQLAHSPEITEASLKIVSASSNWIELEFAAHRHYILYVNNLLAHLMSDLEEREVQLLLYAFQELMQNAIEHGSHNSPEERVNVCWIRTHRLIMFKVSDSGKGFRMESLPHAAIGSRKKQQMEVAEYRKKSGMRPGGLGILSVTGIADELIYNQKGNAVTMLKYLVPLD